MFCCILNELIITTSWVNKRNKIKFKSHLVLSRIKQSKKQAYKTSWRLSKIFLFKKGQGGRETEGKGEGDRRQTMTETDRQRKRENVSSTFNLTGQYSPFQQGNKRLKDPDCTFNYIFSWICSVLVQSLPVCNPYTMHLGTSVLSKHVDVSASILNIQADSTDTQARLCSSIPVHAAWSWIKCAQREFRNIQHLLPRSII